MKWTEIERERLVYESKELIKKLWCNDNVLRQKILDLSLTLEITDDLEKMNLTNPNNTSPQWLSGYAVWLIPRRPKFNPRYIRLNSSM